jgi:Mg2+ and Co2+ transporter CorA
VHVERTLDEAYLPGLNIHELAARNDDQVVSKFRSSPASGRGVVPLLIIPQLWLWRFGKIVISAHNTSVTLPRSCPLVAHAGLQLGLIIADCIMGFGRELVRPHEGVRIPPTLDLFENRVVSILSDVKKYMDHPKREIEFSKEAGFHHDLSDCRSELAMIKHFLKQQEEILNQLLDDCSRNKEASYPIDRKAPTKDQEAPALGDKEASSSQTKEASSSGGNQGLPPRNGDTTPQPQLKQAITAAAWQPVEDARQMLKEYQKRIQKIDGDAERIEKNVQDLLSLKRTYASVKMSEASVELARASVRDSHASVLLSVAAIGFAIVTIIFTPLAFLVGLFALNLQGFDRLRVNSDGNAGRRTRAVGDAANERDIAANVVSDNNPVYHSGKIAGIFGKLQVDSWPFLEIMLKV